MKTKNILNKARFILILLPCLLMTPWTFAQTTVQKGNIKDKSGAPIVGTNIKIKGTTNETLTDSNGDFTLSGISAQSTLVISYTGYITQEVPSHADTNLSITLLEDDVALDEVVVIGYQTVRRRDLTGSVASVGGKELATAPVINVAQALQGKLPGVNVTSQDGRPNGNVSIRIRGGGSISQSNEPLVLIDGIPGKIADVPSDMVESVDVLKDASSTAIYGARGANGVVLITTKRAKAGKSSITYSGFGKFNAPTGYMEALNPYDYLAFKWAMLDAYQDVDYVTPFKELFAIGDKSTFTKDDVTYSNPLGINAYRNVQPYNLQKELYNSSFSHNHDLSIAGGTDMTKILVAASYMDEDGMKLMSNAKRASAFVKIDQKISKNLKFNLDLRYTDRRTQGNEGTTSGAGSILSSAYRFRPIAVGDMLGDKSIFSHATLGEEASVMNDVTNPVNRTKDIDNVATEQNFLGTAGARWNILKNLSYFSELTLSRTYNKDRNWSGATTDPNFFVSTGTMETIDRVIFAGNADSRFNDRWNLRWTNTLNFDILQNDTHRLNVLGGQEVTTSGGSDMRINALRFPSNFTKENAFAMMNQFDSSVATNMTVSTAAVTPARILSYFGRANYSLLDRYLLTATMRADGSSRFSPDQQWGYFPAVAAAWRVSNESFLKSQSWITDLKLRASYGEVGNDAIDPNQWNQLWVAETDPRSQGILNNLLQPAYDLASAQFANRNLKWETTVTRNVGLDFTLLNSRLSGTIEVYSNNTKDLLMLTDIPSITGFNTSYANVGQTSNKGIEISLSGTIFSNDDWNISAGGNFNRNNPNVDFLAEGVQSAYGTQFLQSNLPNNDYLLEEGKPVGIVMGYKTVGRGFYETSDFTYDAATGGYTLNAGVPDLSPQFVPHHKGVVPAGQQAYPGMPKFEDIDGNGIIDTKDFVEIGNMTPKHTGGFNLTVSYKRIDFAAYFNWSYGNQVYNANKLASLYNGNKGGGLYSNKLDIVNDGYKVYDIDASSNLVRITDPTALDALNQNATLPLTYMHQGYVSDIGIEDGSFLRLNTLTLGYNVPSQWLSKVGMSSLRIYGTVFNVATITGYTGIDPEVNANPNINNARYPTPGFDWGAYPRPRQYTFGLNASF
ncbi:SusC/RagA family TonB-linked outer membrane protein [Sphingobacterium pedocola]|uniref:SusC/RagA family TonB-linked outer membrane protein n=1 Tax=Sphingobacterium pedocola TaxID=2082722 RepID=A0ABR9TBT9_9SPHI|nr:TonB-dependent receptor [Sphingobacterium pedocola]MBE8722766.1 SusC/RagA family TonB-linked outer membrane protein [Sphingobacterium pedocola]